ncbi:FAD binding domain-containing protein [Jannaschia aquimarina]|uniref:CoxM_2 protein n=1 Tax=Jannaschia aquimarina TaxID=935700 RepID=A0A0D1D8I4_9RHOB|nr:FAD binding domain-containing protein [Jannaschia aquimarina]KIT16228.1 Carbon monoxide dehydrogenase medium chain [Jannaschia aquimarina]SNT15743.1 CO or xanthine dehydrogenase, FAD-binding subunit [Jannaschia aquimarina]
MTRVETVATTAEAARILSDGAAYLGGGTMLMRAVNAGTAPPRLVRTADPVLRAVSARGDTVTVGAGVTMARILAEPQLDFLHPVARAVGSPQIRNMATVGGNLFAPHPYGDFAVALLALGARARMAGAGGTRPLDDLLRDRDRPGGLVEAVEIPRPPARAFRFHKVSRVKPRGVSVISIAVLAPSPGGKLAGVRVAYGAMGPTPLRAAAVERVLEGGRLDQAARERAVAVAAEGLDPPTDALASGWYRGEVAGVHLGRLLARMEEGR